MGFEPGQQRGAAKWEGMDVDKQVIDYVQSSGYGGVFWWAINERGYSADMPTGKNS